MKGQGPEESNGYFFNKCTPISEPWNFCAWCLHLGGQLLFLHLGFGLTNIQNPNDVQTCYNHFCSELEKRRLIIMTLVLFSSLSYNNTEIYLYFFTIRTIIYLSRVLFKRSWLSDAVGKLPLLFLFSSSRRSTVKAG